MNTRAVIYCRVSTELESQESSLDAQIIQATEIVKEKGWILVDEYIDSGKSGTTTQNRTQYNRLMRNMPKNVYDVIVVKSQDRLMRSTRDWYIFIDTMLKYKKKVYFYMENYFYEPDDALITGVKAILAEEFSRELSKKTNNAHQKRQQTGKIMLNSRTLGYRNNNGIIEVDEKEAEIVRLIFQLRVEGYGSSTIAKILTSKGIVSKKGVPFGSSSISKVLRNTIYYGTMTMNRKHYDFDTKKIYWNEKEDWIVRENALPPIVDYSLWKKANDLMDIKSEQFKTRYTMKSLRGIKTEDHPLAGKIICGECNQKYNRSKQKRKYDSVLRWRCREYLNYGRKDTKKAHLMRSFDPNYDRGCNNIVISDDDLKQIMILIFNEYPDINKNLIEQIQGITNQVFIDFYNNQKKQFDKKMKNIQMKRSALLESFLETEITKEQYQVQEKELEELKNQIVKSYNTDSELEAKLFGNKTISQKIKDKVAKIVSEELAEIYMYEHISQIFVFSDHLVFSFDLFPDVCVDVDRSNYHKKSFKIVNTLHIDNHNTDTIQ